MQLPVFENACFLQSLGWAIANSFWQTGVLWLVYVSISNLDKKLPALAKYHLSLVLLFSAFTWFIFTFYTSYRILASATSEQAIFLNHEWSDWVKLFSQALPFLSIVYLFLLGGYIIKFIHNLSANRILQTNGLVKAPIDFRLFTTRAAFNLGIKKKIRVWLSAHVDVPSVTGFLNPVILLPIAMVSHLSVQQVEAVLIHELAHIRRNDYVVNLIQSVVELILFFNPFALMLGKAAKIERENCCDDWVLNFQYDRYEYAKALMILEEQRHSQHLSFALAATNGKKNLLFRVKRLFNTTPQVSVSALQKLKLSGLCLVLFVGFFNSLPLISTKPAQTSTGSKVNSETTNHLAKTRKVPEENVSKTIVKSPIVKSTSPKRTFSEKRTAKKQAANDDNEAYVNAFINEALLNSASKETPIASQVVDKETNNSNYIIKIEEQQSGKKETNTYYFELNNQDGNPSIKPLIIFNKVDETGKKTVRGNVVDSSAGTKKQVTKKRITS